jgi:hypothetical protein
MKQHVRNMVTGRTGTVQEIIQGKGIHQNKSARIQFENFTYIPHLLYRRIAGYREEIVIMQGRPEGIQINQQAQSKNQQHFDEMYAPVLHVGLNDVDDWGEVELRIPNAETKVQTDFSDRENIAI